MNIDDINFKEEDDYATSFYSDYLNSEICLEISDDLEACEEELSEKYKKEILKFIEEMHIWHPIVVEKIKEWGRNDYNVDTDSSTIKLCAIHIEYEQGEVPLFCLSYHVDFEPEHGCYPVICGETFEIKALGDVHFSMQYLYKRMLGEI